MVLHGGVVIEQQILPVGVGGHLVGILIARTLTGVHQTLVLHDHIASGVEHVAMLPCRLPALREIVVHRYLTHLTLLRGHEDHTVGGTGTIDGARGSVLQHLDTLDVAGVDVVETTLDGHAVDDIQRVTVVHRTDTTHADAGCSTRLTRR